MNIRKCIVVVVYRFCFKDTKVHGMYGEHEFLWQRHILGYDGVVSTSKTFLNDLQLGNA